MAVIQDPNNMKFLELYIFYKAKLSFSKIWNGFP